MKLEIRIDRTAALLEGSDQEGNITLEVKPSELTREQREYLANLSNADRISLPYLQGVTSVTKDTIGSILDQLIAKKREEFEAKQARIDKQVQDAIDEIKSLPISIEIINDDGFIQLKEPALIVYDYYYEVTDRLDRIANKPGFEYKSRVLLDPEVAEIEKKVSKRLNEIRENNKRIRQEQKEAEELKKLETEGRRTNQLKTWVSEHGTNNQKRRFERNMLPEDEILQGIRDQVFEPLNDYPRYSKITKSEVDSDNPDDVMFSVNPITELDAETFDKLEEFENLMPEAKCELFRHVGTSGDEDSAIVRNSIKVTVTVGELTLSREYAL